MGTKVTKDVPTVVESRKLRIDSRETLKKSETLPHISFKQRIRDFRLANRTNATERSTDASIMRFIFPFPSRRREVSQLIWRKLLSRYRNRNFCETIPFISK